VLSNVRLRRTGPATSDRTADEADRPATEIRERGDRVREAGIVVIGLVV
jgi:hypothetical protein